MLAQIIYKLTQNVKLREQFLAHPELAFNLNNLNIEEQNALALVLKNEGWQEEPGHEVRVGWGPGFWGA
ncbi:MAG: hypothetical protein QNJ45_13005 [Ardenticatenaceae bacterium]|nr:hypothetical protein [Ardenticatenaceae bacterium]